MSLRWQFTRDGRFQVPYKVEIYDSEYEGSPTTLGTVSGQPVELTLGKQGADPLEKIKASSITVRLWGETGDFGDLFDRNNTRFKIKLYIDGEFDSEFIPVPDTFKDYDTPGSYTNEIKAANFALLKQKQASGVVSDGSRLQAIQDILDVYFDVPVEDGTVFYPTEANTGGSSLAQQNVQAARVEDMNCYEALEFLLHKGMQIRMTKGKAIIIPVTEASFTAYTAGGSSTLYDDNFVSTKIGGRLSKTRSRLRTYDGVRRTYQPLDADNIVPSGDFELEDFNLTDPETDEFNSNGRVEALPSGWSEVRTGVGATYAKLNGQDVSWQIPESLGSFADQAALEANGLITYQSWTAEAGQVLAGTRLKIMFTHNYESVNKFAHIPIKIKVGDQILFRGRNINGQLVAGTPEWREESAGLSRHVDHVLIGTRANTGYKDWEFITPPIPETGTLSVEVETPSVDRSWEPGDNNFLEIAQFAIDPANESGEILIENEVLAGSEGDVYEYTEGFGDGFSSFNPGALFNKDEEISFTPKAENLTELWVYNGTDGNVPSTELPLAELETKYLFSQLSTDRDRKNGTVDVYDFLALIDGLRVNYMNTDFRYGRSKVELVEIRDHDLDAVIEDRKKKKDTGVIRHKIDPPFTFFNQDRAIGETTEAYENEQRTSVGVELDNPVRAGTEYFIVNENETIPTDRLAGLYPIIPQRTDENGDVVLPDDPDYETSIKEYGPGLLDGDSQTRLPIEEQRINAPAGSLIFKAPGQDETETIVTEKKIVEVNVRVDNTETNVSVNASSIVSLESTVTTHGTEITANSTAILEAEADIVDLENDVSGNASSILTLDSRVTTNEGDISANASAILAAEVDIDDLESDTSANASSILTLESDVSSIEGDVSANASAILSAESRITDAENDIDANASATLSLDSRVTVTEGEIADIEATAVLKVDANGRIASVSLSAGHDGSTISIRGDQIDINNIVFDESGAIRTSNFSAGSAGWIIEGDGDAEFNDVRIRGAGSSIGDNAVLENLTVNGTLTMDTGEITNTGAGYSIVDSGIMLRTGNEVLERSIVFRDSFPSGTLRAELTTATSPNRLLLRSSNGYHLMVIGSGDTTVRSVTGDVTIDSVAGDVNIDSDGDTILSNPNGDIKFISLPDFDPASFGVIYRSGNDLRFSTG